MPPRRNQRQWSDGSQHSTQSERNSSRNIKCRNCGRNGHVAQDCRRLPNNNNNSSNDNNNNSSTSRRNNSNDSRRCEKCPNGKHDTEQCKKINANRDFFCEWHNSDSHCDRDCADKRNPKSDRRDGDSRRKGDKDGDTAMEGYAFSQPIAFRPIPSDVQYCRLHNTTAHTELTCAEAAIQRSLGAGVVCWKCSERGHLGDECKNPKAVFCFKCHKSGHGTTECSKRSRVDELRVQLSTLGPSNATRNHWPQPTFEGPVFVPRLTRSQEMREELRQEALKSRLSADEIAAAEATIAEQERAELNVPAKSALGVVPRVSSIYQSASWTPLSRDGGTDGWLHQSQRGREHASPMRTDRSRVPKSPKHYGGIIKPSSPFHAKGSGPEVAGSSITRRIRAEQRSEREKAVRAKVLKSRTMYKLEWANQYIRNVSTRLLETQTMTRENLWRIHKAMCQNPPVNIFRDPEAVNGIANLERPFCNTCHERGIVVDRHFNDVPVEQDVVRVEDWEDWGVFVAFDCQCCKKDGWTYERLEREEVAMEIELQDARA